MTPIGRPGFGSRRSSSHGRATGPTELELRRIVTPTLRTTRLEGGATGSTKRYPRRILKATARAAHRRLLPHVMPRGRMTACETREDSLSVCQTGPGVKRKSPEGYRSAMDTMARDGS